MTNVPSKHFSKKRKRKRELFFNMTRYLLLGILLRFSNLRWMCNHPPSPLVAEDRKFVTRRDKKKRRGGYFCGNISNCGSTTTSCQQLIRADNGVELWTVTLYQTWTPKLELRDEAAKQGWRRGATRFWSRIVFRVIQMPTMPLKDFSGNPSALGCLHDSENTKRHKERVQGQ